MALEIRKLAPTFGAEVSGIAITRPLTPEEEADVIDAIATYGVCVYRDTGLTDETHVWFSRVFGNLWTVAGQTGRPTYDRYSSPYLFDAGNLTKDGAITRDELALTRKKGDRLWHTDSSFTTERTTYSLLLAHEVTAEGGETHFADMRAAYDALSDATKQRIDGLVAEHSYLYSRQQAGFPVSDEEIDRAFKARHPLVHVHPGSGRKSLYIAAHAMGIVGMDKAAGRALLDELIAHATQPQFTFSHRWRVGDLVIWDNFCTMHRGGDYDTANERRDLRRTTVMASPPPPVVLNPRLADRFDKAQFEAMAAA